ncbi:FtsQ-type POTRA domain-containing protein [Candidatus Parcubacteria bacterium]|jgi:cell division septal protein FtsQ|nr:FtsQ-type POTRA domain-containing protein [Candidatus Parcubacteria bacterium]
MRRRIVNHHKIKKQVGRKFKRSHGFLLGLFGSRNRRKRDFSWQGRESNPYRTQKKDHNWSFIIKISILVGSTITVLAMCIYSSFFHISDINITGLQRIGETEIRNTIDGISSYKTLNIFPRKSYFLTDINEIRDILKERFPLRSVIVQKTFPNKLSIIIEEKISTLIYDNGKEYSYIGLEGNVVEKMRNVGDYEWNIKTETATSTNAEGEIETHEKIIERKHVPDTKTLINELGDYPIVYDKREKTVEINEAVLSSKEIQSLIEWFNILTKTTDIPLKYFVIEGEVGDFVVSTYEGWVIKTHFENDVSSQIEKLKTILKEKVKRPQINYIDLRYEGRVYLR